jgi:hypothetical protein
MDGMTAQIVALGITGNYFLRGGNVESDWLRSPVSDFCNSVEFWLPPTGEGNHGQLSASDVLTWLSQARTENVEGFRLHMLSNVHLRRGEDRTNAAFVGGGKLRLLESVRKRASDLWESGWEIGDRHHPEGRLWLVRYWRTKENYERAPMEQPDMWETKKSLRSALLAALNYACKNDLQPFTAQFQTAVDLLDKPSPLDASGYFRSYKYHDLSLEACQVLAALGPAWVFGGMGSWNDLGRDGDDEYVSISRALYDEVTLSAADVVNSSFNLVL